MRLLELFCGTKSIAKAFERQGFETTTLDFDPQFEPDLLADILTVDPESFGGHDVVWASPPCQAFTVSTIGRNWYYDGKPRTDKAREGIAIVEKTWDIIYSIQPTLYFIENPVGMLRKLDMMVKAGLQTVTYCQYGDKRMKPTDIWTNSYWLGRQPCKIGGDCHESAPRGSTTSGTQGLGSAVERAMIPPELCDEIATFARRFLETQG